MAPRTTRTVSDTNEPTTNAQFLKHHRLQAGVSLRELEEHIGLSDTYISLIENGKKDAPPQTIRRLLRGIAEIEAAKTPAA